MIFVDCNFSRSRFLPLVFTYFHRNNGYNKISGRRPATGFRYSCHVYGNYCKRRDRIQSRFVCFLDAHYYYYYTHTGTRQQAEEKIMEYVFYAGSYGI